MQIYLNTEGGTGYQYILNTNPAANGTTTLSRVTGQGDDLSAEIIPDVTAYYDVRGNRLRIKVPRKAIGLDHGPFTVWFKAVDSTVPVKNIADFYDMGDAAPLGRLNFVYKGEE